MSSARPTPEWPSLYNFLIEVNPIPHRDPVQPQGFYLYNSNGKRAFSNYVIF